MAESLAAEISGRRLQIRRYPTVVGPAEPAALIGRLALEGIRLRRFGPVLLAAVPQAVAAARSWPALDRLLCLHAASLAVTADLARRLAAELPGERIVALLAELDAAVPAIVRETVCGEERLRSLLGSSLTGADLDLACVAVCRGLAIRELSRCSAGPSGEREGDHGDRERGYGAARGRGRWTEPPAAARCWRSPSAPRADRRPE